jgi:thiol-disulfide isomerase/thioredoxin
MALSVKHMILAGLVAVAAISTALQGPQYPGYVTEKTLYAKNDLRGKKAPEFSVEQWMNREKVDLKGKVVLVDFWATWCGPCRAVIPELNDFQKKFGDKLVVIGVSNEKPEIVKKFMEGTKMEYAVAVDMKQKMMDVLGVEGIPHVMIISPDGIVRWQGFPSDDKDKLTEQVIEQIIAASSMK